MSTWCLLKTSGGEHRGINDVPLMLDFNGSTVPREAPATPSLHQTPCVSEGKKSWPLRKWRKQTVLSTGDTRKLCFLRCQVVVCEHRLRPPSSKAIFYGFLVQWACHVQRMMPQLDGRVTSPKPKGLLPAVVCRGSQLLPV